VAEKQPDPFNLKEQTFVGAGRTLQAALESAWAQAKEPGTYRVVDIYFAAENPITEYSVVIGHI
jgi:hypothetical protein